MLQEEIARLTGTLKFNVDARPLATFEKRLGGVMNMLRELSTLANKKFTVKVALDSRSLRAQIEKATKTKISLTNVDISNEALALQGKRIQDHLNKTTINLANVRVDINKLVEQKRFVRTLLGQMDVKVPVKLKLNEMEAELRKELKVISDRNPLKIKIDLNNNNLAMKLRRAMIEAQRRMGELKIRVAETQVRLKVDKQHLVEEIRLAIASHQFDIRVGAGRGGFGGGGGNAGRPTGSGRGQAERGLSAAAGFARGALPGLGAAFAFSQMNDINQRVTAATNSLEAVSGNQANFNSNRNFVNNMAKEMGLNFRDVAPQFSSIFQAASPAVGVKGTQDMFRGIMKYGTVHGLDKEAMKGSMVALSQMFGKDKIQSEEARQQFAERMPNGMALLAKAAGNAGLGDGTVKSFGDLMQKGNADPKKILPELGKLMEQLADKNDAYKKSLETTRVAQGRMNNAFEDTVVIFAKGGFDRGMASFFNTLTDSMNKSTPLVEALGGAFEVLVKPLNALIRIVGHIGAAWPKFAEALGVTEKQLAVMATTLGILLLPFGQFIVAIGAAALALDDFLTYLEGGDSYFGDWVKGTEGAQEAIDNIVFAFDGLAAAWDDLKSAFGDGNNPFKDWSIDSVLLQNLQYIQTVIDSMSAALRALVQFKQGDYSGALSGLGTGIKNAVVNNPGVQMYSKIPEFYSGVVGDLANRGQDWLQSQRRHSTMPMPSPLAANAQGGGATQAPVTVAPGAISLQITVPAPEGSDPKQFADKFGPHIQELTKAAVLDVFGQARAQQAERQ